MANKAGHSVTSTPTDLASGITVGTRVIYQNLGKADVFLFEGSATDRDAGTPNVIRGAPFYDGTTYLIESDPIWAWTEGDKRSRLAVVY